jgi:activated CDC42 kinase 1
MAPEQMERRAYSRASDVFAFGVLLFEIFKREEPWQGVSNLRRRPMVVQWRAHGRDVEQDSGFEIATLMLECWAHEPDKRPSMKQVQSVLHDYAPRTDESATES